MYPVLGLFCTIIGAIVAITLVPSNPLPAGALYYSGLAMAVGLAIAPIIASLRQPKTILRAEHIVVLSPIYWILLDLLQGVYPLEMVSVKGVEGAFIAIALFIGGVWVATMLPPWQLPKIVIKSASYTLSANTFFKLVIIFFCLGIFNFAYASNFNPFTMFQYVGVGRWYAPWSRGQFGTWSAFVEHLAYFGYLLPTFTVLLATRSKWFKAQVFVAILLSLLMTAFLAQGGGRRIVGVVFGAALVTWVLEQKHFKFRQAIVFASATACLLVIMQLMLEYRNVGYQTFFTNDRKPLQYQDLHVDDNFLRLSQIIDIVPNFHPFVHEKQIVYIMTLPIPRVLWPSKPTGPGFDLPAILGKVGVSLASSIIGEWYLVAGWLTVLVGGFLHGRFAQSASLLLMYNTKASSSVIVYSLSVMTLFAGMRSMQNLLFISYTILAWIGLSSLIFGSQKNVTSDKEISRDHLTLSE